MPFKRDNNEPKADADTEAHALRVRVSPAQIDDAQTQPADDADTEGHLMRGKGG